MTSVRVCRKHRGTSSFVNKFFKDKILYFKNCIHEKIASKLFFLWDLSFFHITLIMMEKNSAHQMPIRNTNNKTTFISLTLEALGGSAGIYPV